jgi:hypothetical protein
VEWRNSTLMTQGSENGAKQNGMQFVIVRVRFQIDQDFLARAQ